jgi:DNA-directed RNA polymerase subunit alpha
VEVVNPNMVIATLTDKDAELEMELIVNQGRGYVPTETREKEAIEPDMIAIDAIYTPVRNVGFRIENVRVGQMTNYENLLLDIETDGSVTPLEALTQANSLLMEHFTFIEQNAESATLGTPSAVEAEPEAESVDVAPEPEEEKKPKKTRTKKADKDKEAEA